MDAPLAQLLTYSLTHLLTYSLTYLPVVDYVLQVDASLAQLRKSRGMVLLRPVGLGERILGSGLCVHEVAYHAEGASRLESCDLG